MPEGTERAGPRFIAAAVIVQEVVLVTWWKAVKLGIALTAAIVVLSSCVSAGFVGFDTARSLPPGHVAVRVGAEATSLGSFPESFASVHVGLPLGAELGVHAGLGTLLAGLKYHVPFAWKKAAVAIGIGGGANFTYQVKQLDAPVILSYRFNKALAVTASQTTTVFIGTYPGFAVSGGAGVKSNIGRFYLFPKVVAGYFSPGSATWGHFAKACDGSGFSLTACLYNVDLDLTKARTFASVGLAMGYAF